MCSTLAKHTFAVLCVHYFHRIAQRNDNLRVGLKALISWAAFLEPRYAVEASPIFSHFEQRQNSSDNPPEFEQFFDRKKISARKIGVL